MAKPITFPEQNGVVGDTPVYRDGGKVLTCHAFTPAEMIEIMNTGKVWLVIEGHTLPNVAVVGAYPFDKKVN